MSQIKVIGKVISKDDKSVLPGVNIVEKGTTNGTSTNLNGKFEIAVSKNDAILVFSFIGLITQEVKIEKISSEKPIAMESDCNKDFFDEHTLRVHLISGIINTPLGSKFDFSTPAYFAILKTSIGYQSNFKSNEMINTSISLSHLFVTCDFDADVSWYYRKITFSSKSFLESHSLEADLNFDPFIDFDYVKIIVGYTTLNDYSINSKLNGGVIGIGAWLGTPLYLQAKAKVSLYNSHQEYNAKLEGGRKSLNVYLNFYKYDSFNELTVGIGHNFGYGYKRILKKNTVD